MNRLLTSAGTLALATLLLTARAQTTPAAPAKSDKTKVATSARTADQRAATYTGPRVVKDSKALGRKMIRNSQPVTLPVPTPPVKRY